MQKILFIGFALTAGCSVSGIKENFDQAGLLDSGYSSRIIDPKTTRPVDLATLLDVSQPVTVESRNATQSKLLAQSEVNCTYFVEALHNRRAATNVTLGTLTTIASTAAAIVAGRAGQNLAGTAAVLSSTSNSINQEMYSGILMPAITREILETRTKMYESITKRQILEVKVYPLALAVTDAIKFHNLCSVPFALVGLVNKASSNATQNIDISGALNSIDMQIANKKKLLSDPLLGFSNEQKNKLRDQLLDLDMRRSVLAGSFLADSETKNNEPIATPTPDQGTPVKPGTAPTTPVTPAIDSKVMSPIIAPGLE